MDRWKGRQLDAWAVGGFVGDLMDGGTDGGRMDRWTCGQVDRWIKAKGSPDFSHEFIWSSVKYYYF